MATELTLVAKYTSFVSRAEDILRAAAAKQWAPATTELIDVAKQGGWTNIREGRRHSSAFWRAVQVRQAGGQKGKPLAAIKLAARQPLRAWHEDGNLSERKGATAQE